MVGGISVFLGLLSFFSLAGAAFFFGFYAIENGEHPSFAQMAIGGSLVFFICLVAAAFFSSRHARLPDLEGTLQHALVLWGAVVVVVSLPSGILMNELLTGGVRATGQALTAAGAMNMLGEINPRLESSINIWKGKVDNRMVPEKGKVDVGKTVKKAQSSVKQEIEKPAIQSIIKPAIAEGRDYAKKASIIGALSLFFGAIGSILGSLGERMFRRSHLSQVLDFPREDRRKRVGR